MEDIQEMEELEYLEECFAEIDEDVTDEEYIEELENLLSQGLMISNSEYDYAYSRGLDTSNIMYFSDIDSWGWNR
jgi:hypothetical protein